MWNEYLEWRKFELFLSREKRQGVILPNGNFYPERFAAITVWLMNEAKVISENLIRKSGIMEIVFFCLE